MTVFYVELDNWQKVIKVMKSSAAQIAEMANYNHDIELPRPHSTKTGWRVWVEAEDEDQAGIAARRVEK